jgi:hypothetical protein
VCAVGPPAPGFSAPLHSSLLKHTLLWIAWPADHRGAHNLCTGGCRCLAGTGPDQTLQVRRLSALAVDGVHSQCLHRHWLILWPSWLLAPSCPNLSALRRAASVPTAAPCRPQLEERIRERQRLRAQNQLPEMESLHGPHRKPQHRYRLAAGSSGGAAAWRPGCRPCHCAAICVPLAAADASSRSHIIVSLPGCMQGGSDHPRWLPAARHLTSAAGCNCGLPACGCTPAWPWMFALVFAAPP